MEKLSLPEESFCGEFCCFEVAAAMVDPVADLALVAAAVAVGDLALDALPA